MLDLDVLLICGLINLHSISGVKFYLKTEMKRLSIDPEIKDARCGYRDYENPTQKFPALILTDFNPTTRTPPTPTPL